MYFKAMESDNLNKKYGEELKKNSAITSIIRKTSDRLIHSIGWTKEYREKLSKLELLDIQALNYPEKLDEKKLVSELHIQGEIDEIKKSLADWSINQREREQEEKISEEDISYQWNTWQNASITNKWGVHAALCWMEENNQLYRLLVMQRQSLDWKDLSPLQSIQKFTAEFALMVIRIQYVFRHIDDTDIKNVILEQELATSKDRFLPLLEDIYSLPDRKGPMFWMLKETLWKLEDYLIRIELGEITKLWKKNFDIILGNIEEIELALQ